jgi:hypothetical protein
MNHDTMKSVIKALEDDLDDLSKGRSDSSLNTVRNTPPVKSDMGDYNAGQQMYTTVENARTQIGGAYDEFLRAYRKAIQGLIDSERNVKKADEKSEEGARGAGGGAYA